jgi:hypothetical protein
MPVNVENYQQIANYLSTYKAKLVAVSKTKPLADIQELVELGQRDFGENYVQELQEKEEVLKSKCKWHFIGHLQSNKVKAIAPFVHLIHGVDSFKLLKEINKQGAIIDRKIDCLLQIHIASEETKFGFDEAEAEALMLYPELAELEHINIRGIMGMATNTTDHTTIAKEFKQLKNIFDNCRIMSFNPKEFNTLSMGMTSDYKIALDCGSNMVRIGSAIFGERG